LPQLLVSLLTFGNCPPGVAVYLDELFQAVSREMSGCTCSVPVLQSAGARTWPRLMCV